MGELRNYYLYIFPNSNPIIIWECYTKFGHKTSKYPHS
jgi:hypothetical protein